VRTLDAHLYDLNPASPDDRKILLAEQQRLEMKLDAANREIDRESYNHGYRAAQRVIDRRDRIDQQLTEIFGLLHEHDFSGIARCRTARCQNVAGPAFTHSGFCSDCHRCAVTGISPDLDNSLPEPLIGSVFGR
jgi:hypothetical protein